MAILLWACPLIVRRGLSLPKVVEILDAIGPHVTSWSTTPGHRAAPYAAARTWAQDIYLALARIRNTALSGTYYFWVSPLQSVFELRTDDYSRPIMSFQVRVGKAV